MLSLKRCIRFDKKQGEKFSLFKIFLPHGGRTHTLYIASFFFLFEKMPATWMISLESIPWQRLKSWTISALQIQFNWKNPWDLVKKNSDVFILQAIRPQKWITSGKENFKTFFISQNCLACEVTEFYDSFTTNQAVACRSIKWLLAKII